MKLFVNNLSVLDFSYIDFKRGIVGESLIASLLLSGQTDEQGMICDFGIVKKRVKQYLDNTVDHTLVVPIRQAGLHAQTENHITTVEWQDDRGRHYKCQGPSQAFTLIDKDNISPAHISEAVRNSLGDILNTPGIDRIDLTLSSESINHAYYHYTHGLKKHLGQCQRIAHGHRSRIEIWQHDKRRYDIEQRWANQWRDIYLGTQEDITEQVTHEDKHAYYHFSYEASEGKYHLEIPTEDCYILDTDTTVELIAKHIAQALYERYPSEEFTVRAFEGVDKGACFSTVDL